MSASLVGSEMCIRDRLMFECVQCGVKSNAQLVCSACQKPLPALDEMTAVSYTHLTLPDDM
eukprot:3116597-Alexandrium_andersonii.AAC.1